ncbi:MAG: UDP-4-amino-4,6-dideoxy-N-acetyl-beta-L-altrosamine transaminase [Pyrinomonadaceae bacterium]
MLPYGQQSIDEDDIAAIVEVLRSDWLTTGPKVDEFEHSFAAFVGAEHAVAVSNGTAALHAAMYALGIKRGDEVIVPALTFAATANCVLYQGGTPVFADVEVDTLLLDVAQVEARITPRTKAIIAVDYAGQPCDYDALSGLAARHDLVLVADACHALGGDYQGRNVGTLAALNTFSFHPVKPIATGEGGMISTNNAELANRMRVFRNHGITSDHRQRAQTGAFFYEMTDLGYNYRLTDIQCALGLNQLRKLPEFVRRRRNIAALYDEGLAKLDYVQPLARRAGRSHAYHLYSVRCNTEMLGMDRATIFSLLRQNNIGVNVHYIPVHLHPYYREHLHTEPGLCPVAEAAYEELLTLPLFPDMAITDVEDVLQALQRLRSFACKN